MEARQQRRPRVRHEHGGRRHGAVHQPRRMNVRHRLRYDFINTRQSWRGGQDDKGVCVVTLCHLSALTPNRGYSVSLRSSPKACKVRPTIATLTCNTWNATRSTASESRASAATQYGNVITRRPPHCSRKNRWGDGEPPTGQFAGVLVSPAPTSVGMLGCGGSVASAAASCRAAHSEAPSVVAHTCHCRQASREGSLAQWMNAKTHSWGLMTLLSVCQWCYQLPCTCFGVVNPPLHPCFESNIEFT